MEDNTCEGCGIESELYHNEAHGLAYCEDCDQKADAEAEGLGVFHAELRDLLAEIDLAQFAAGDAGSVAQLVALKPHAEALLALPEESVAGLVEAAQAMVSAASFGR